MSIEKNTKNSLVHEDGGFTTLLNSTLQNIRNPGALAVYCYLASKPTDWEICKIHLQNHFLKGKDYINSCFKHLKEIGALEIKMNRDEKGKCTGWITILKSRINVQYVYDIQNAENQDSGDSSRILKNQNLGKPESGKSALTNKRRKTKERERNKIKTNPPVCSVFSDSVSVLSHIDLISKNRKLTVSSDHALEILFYIGEEKDFDVVVKKINIALKAIREGKWNTPYGFNNKPTLSTTQSRKIKEETDEERQERQFFTYELLKEKENISYLSKPLQKFPEMRKKYEQYAKQG